MLFVLYITLCLFSELMILQVIYEQGGVFIHFSSSCSDDDDDIMLGGTLKVVEKVYIALLVTFLYSRVKQSV